MSGIDDKPLFSIVMPAYKAERFLRETIASVQAQEVADWELIVVNDGSPDATLGVAKACAAEDSRIVVVDRENGGVSAARNSGIAQARGKNLAFIDADDLWFPKHLVVMQQFLDGADIAVSGASFFRSRPGDMDREQGLDDETIDGFPGSLARRNFIIPTMTAMNAGVMEELGGFDEAPEIQHVEDWDLWLRAVEAGKVFAFSRQATVGYRRHDDAATADGDRIRRAAVFCIEKLVSANHSMTPELKRMGARFLRHLGNARYPDDPAAACADYRKSLSWDPTSWATRLYLCLAKTRLLSLFKGGRKNLSLA